jgi:Holliday junction resolvasome RuvABC DNA-binding subunit
MRAEVLVDHTKDGVIEISVLRQGMSSGAVQRYNSADEAKAALAALGFAEELVNSQLKALWQAPVGGLLRFPVSDVPDDILRSLGFKAV